MQLGSGRGHHYTPWRALREVTFTTLYAGGWPARFFGRFARAGRVEVREHRVQAAGHHGPPLRLAFLSDLHLGPTTAAATLDAAFARAAASRPDVLALGGDHVFLEATPARAAELARRVAAFPARTKLSVLGNHDLWTHHERLEHALRGAGAHVLVNDALRLPAPHEHVAVLGIDDPYAGAPDAARAVAACGDARVRIAVSHAPEGRPLLAGHDVAVVLCGHTHGGHVALPDRPIYVPGPLGKRYPFGRFDDGDPTLIVSRGIGCISVPFRVNAPPDVLVVDVVEPGVGGAP